MACLHCRSKPLPERGWLSAEKKADTPDLNIILDIVHGYRVPEAYKIL